MSRMTYKTVLRAKGIKPIPPYHRLRTRKDGPGEHAVITASEPHPAPRIVSYRGQWWHLIEGGTSK